MPECRLACPRVKDQKTLQQLQNIGSIQVKLLQGSRDQIPTIMLLHDTHNRHGDANLLFGTQFRQGCNAFHKGSPGKVMSCRLPVSTVELTGHVVQGN
jgi:hypothetical protein